MSNPPTIVALAVLAAGCGASAHDPPACEGELPPDAVSGPPECSFRCNDPLAPKFRLSSLAFAEPLRLADPGIDAAIRASIESLQMVWLLDADADGSLTIGNGECDKPWRCRLLSPPEPGQTRWSHDVARGKFEGGEIDRVDLEFVGDFGPVGHFDAQVPFRDVRIEGSTSHDANCIGSRLESGTWEMGGFFSANVRADEAEQVQLEDGETSLCDVVASGVSSSDGYCRDTDPQDWNVQTNARVDDEAAWRVTAQFAATGVLLEQ